NLYFWVKDSVGHDTGWVQTSTWTPAAPALPSVVSATPTNATALSQTFTVTARDPVGYADIGVVYFLVNTSPTVPQNSCHGYYNPAANALYLYNDALTVVMGPVTP